MVNLALIPGEQQPLKPFSERASEFADQLPLPARRALNVGNLGLQGALAVQPYINPLTITYNGVTAGLDMLQPGARVQQGGVLAQNLGRQFMNFSDDQLDLAAPQRQMTPIPTVSQIQAPPLAAQPDTFSGPRFAPKPPAPMAPAAMAAEARPMAAASPMQTNPSPGYSGPATPPVPAVRPEAPSKRDAMVQTMASPETLEAVAQAGSVRGGSIDRSQPEKKGRFNFTPEEMGLMTFGLTLLAGGGVNAAVQNGLSTHSQFDAIRDRKEQKKAGEEFLASVPEEYQPAIKALVASGRLDEAALTATQLEREDAVRVQDKQQRVALAGRVAGMYGISSAALENMSTDRLAQMVSNFADTDNQARLLQIRANNEAAAAQAKAALEQGDTAGSVQYLAQFGVDGSNLPEKALDKQVEKFATGNFSQNESTTAGHAYIMASIIPRMEYLEANFWGGPRKGWLGQPGIAAEYEALTNELALAINRKDSGAAIGKNEKTEVVNLYTFRSGMRGARDESNASAQARRRDKLKSFIGQTGGAFAHLMVNNPISYDSDLLAGGVTLGLETGFVPSSYQKPADDPDDPANFVVEVQ